MRPKSVTSQDSLSLFTFHDMDPCCVLQKNTEVQSKENTDLTYRQSHSFFFFVVFRIERELNVEIVRILISKVPAPVHPLYLFSLVVPIDGAMTPDSMMFLFACFVWNSGSKPPIPAACLASGICKTLFII